MSMCRVSTATLVEGTMRRLPCSTAKMAITGDAYVLRHTSWPGMGGLRGWRGKWRRGRSRRGKGYGGGGGGGVMKRSGGGKGGGAIKRSGGGVEEGREEGR